MTTPRDHRKGVFLMLAAGLCWSTSGILIRSVTLTDAWEVVFWRALFMASFIGLWLMIRYRQRTFAYIAAVGRPGLFAGFLLASTFFFFILSVMQTTVANALVLMSTSPFIAALFGRIFLGEQVQRRTYVAMAAGLVGIALMFVDALSSGGLIGNLLACGVPVAFGANIVLLRRMGASIDRVPTVLLAGVIAVTVALPMGWPLTASWHDVGALAVMGVVQLGAGCLLMALAAPHLSAAEIGLFSLLETTLGPVWVWLGIGERPSDPALLGGIVVVTALVVNELTGFRRAASTASLSSEKGRVPLHRDSIRLAEPAE